MTTHADFEELLKLLEDHQVDYMIVGGYAVAWHGYPRFTKDLDIFYRRTKGNVHRLKKALVGFGFSEADLPDKSFEESGNMVTFGVEPSRVDLLNTIDGVEYDDAKENIQRGRYGDIEVNFIGVRDLLKNKESTRRTRDKADIEELLKRQEE